MKDRISKLIPALVITAIVAGIAGYFIYDRYSYAANQKEAEESLVYFKEIYGNMSMADWLNQASKDAEKRKEYNDTVEREITGQKYITKDQVDWFIDSVVSGTYDGNMAKNDMTKSLVDNLKVILANAKSREDQYDVYIGFIQNLCDSVTPNKKLCPDDYKKTINDKKSITKNLKKMLGR